MEEPDTTAAETAEDQTDAVETTADESTSPPWGDDFDAERAWNTIQTLRGEVKEHKQGSQKARELEEKWDDEQALLDALRQRGFEVDEGEGEDPDLYEEDAEQDDPREQRLARLEAAEAERLYQADLAAALPDGVSEGTLSEPERLFIRQKCVEGGSNKAALKKAVESWQAWRKDLESGITSRRRESKNAPHVSTVGREATEPALPLDAKHSDRVAHMTEQYLQNRQ